MEAKNGWYNGAQSENQKQSKTWNTVCYKVPNKQKYSTIPQENAITVFGSRLYNYLPKYLRDTKVL